MLLPLARATWRRLDERAESRESGRDATRAPLVNTPRHEKVRHCNAMQCTELHRQIVQYIKCIEDALRSDPIRSDATYALQK